MTNDNIRKERIAEDRALLSQQNKEYAESLEKDMAKKMEKERVQLEAERKEQRKKTIQEYKEKVKGTKFHGPLRILVRYPSGSRSILCFTPSNPITNLFDAIISNPACPDYFSVRSIHPRAEIQCFPNWYTDIFNAEFPDEAPKEKCDDVSMKSLETIPNNSILFINMIH